MSLQDSLPETNHAQFGFSACAPLVPPIILYPRRYFRLVGVICTIFMVLVGTASVFVAATNIDGSFKEPFLAACVFGVFWGGFSLLGIYLWIFSHKYQLQVADSAVTQVGVFKSREIDLGSLREAKWRSWPSGGSIKLTADNSAMAIELGTSDSRDGLIQFLRQSIPEEKQIGWEQFSGTGEKTTQQKKSSPVLLAAIFCLLAVASIVGWIFGLGVDYLIMAVANIAFGAYSLLRNRQKAAEDR